MKKALSIVLIVIIAVSSALSPSAYVTGNASDFYYTDQSGAYHISCSGKRAVIDRYASTNRSAQLDLRYTVKQSTLNEERENMYAAFDDTFLNLFPNFVERYNELFDEKDRKVPTRERSLTSEMRIFALIRLGISDSERIARFLDYSVHTVNTYKTRIKNRSIVENDQFDRLIMEI